MVNEALLRYAPMMETLIEGMTRRQIEPVLERLCQDQQWDLMSVALIVAQEVPARAMIDRLLENRQYQALVPCACLRRQLRAATLISGGAGTQVFRDFDAEEATEGVPEHILAEAEDIAAAAKARRVTATVQAANVDRDPLRTLIITKLTEKVLTEPEAVEALIAIAQASAWEETRREAALKLANNRRLVAQLVSQGRVEDLVAIAESTKLQSARQNLAAAMGQQLGQYVAAGNRRALEFLAENHPGEAVREAAKAALG